MSLSQMELRLDGRLIGAQDAVDLNQAITVCSRFNSNCCQLYLYRAHSRRAGLQPVRDAVAPLLAPINGGRQGSVPKHSAREGHWN